MDADWLGRLVDRHAAALELYARQWCDAPEDVVQGAFVKLAGQRVPPENPAAWLFRVVRNGALNAAVASRRRRHHETARAVGWFRTEESETRSGALDPEAACEALGGLPVEQREVIVAHIWGGLTFEQIGELAGSSASTAHRHYSAGLTALRERLGVRETCRKSRPISG
jgi:RNA polymerase sigma-70 factor (ECF subfamily)